MQLIAVDIGNSSIKIAVERSQTDQRWSTISIIRESEPFELDLTVEPAFWSVCSVNQSRDTEFADWIAANRPNDKWHLITDSDVELKSNVESRSQVGRDRLVAAWMAIQLNDGSGPVAVIDAGTAVTVDLVDSNGRFQGGAIFPGAVTTLRNLSDSTDALPDLSNRKYLELLGNVNGEVLGKSTFTAIVKGVHQCQIGGIKHIVDQYQERISETLEVYATGGGITDLQAGLPGSWNIVPDLVLRGAKLIGRKLMTR